MVNLDIVKTGPSVSRSIIKTIESLVCMLKESYIWMVSSFLYQNKG